MKNQKKKNGVSVKKGFISLLCDMNSLSKAILLISSLLCFLASLYILFLHVFSSDGYMFESLVTYQSNSICAVLMSLILGYGGAFILDYAAKKECKK